MSYNFVENITQIWLLSIVDLIVGKKEYKSNNFFNMKKILITGGCGFIGSHLVEYFLNKNKKVIVFDKIGKRFEKNWLIGFKHKNLKIILNDIRNFKKLDSEIKKCDQVIHILLQQSVFHIRTSFQENMFLSIFWEL